MFLSLAWARCTVTADKLALVVSRKQVLYNNIVLDLECHHSQPTMKVQSG